MKRVLVVVSVGLLAGCPWLTVAECTTDAECEAGTRCEPQTSTCVTDETTTSSSTSSSGAASSSTGGASSSASGVSSSSSVAGASASSSAVASSSSGTASSSSGAGTSASTPTGSSSSAGSTSGGVSSSGPRDAGPPPCPTLCGTLMPDGGGVEAWRCEGDGGLDSCRIATCAEGRGNCDDAGVTCEVDLDTDEANCGACGSPVTPTVASDCVEGQPACGAGAACTGTDTCEAPFVQTGATMCCAEDLDNCDDDGLCHDTLTDEEHCGDCGNDITADVSVSECVGGVGVCGATGGACPAEEPVCMPGQGDECFCDSDDTCPESAPICCGGTCTAAADACGCDIVTGGGDTCDPSGTGGLCVSSSGTVLDAAAVTDRAAYHTAVCGCVGNGGLPVADANVCAPSGAFQGLCAGTTQGQCAAQNEPVRAGTTGAGNCGAAGVTCDPSQGGLNCEAVDGVGTCACDSGQPGSDGEDDCTTNVQGPNRAHVVASACLDQTVFQTPTDECRCGASPACDPTTGTPDCCGGACVNLEDTEAHCGLCNADCKGENTCDDRTVDGGPKTSSCSCAVATDCRDGTAQNPGWPTNLCASGSCVCNSFTAPGEFDDNAACPVGAYCCVGIARTGGVGTDTGCCDLPCGSEGNSCITYPGSPRN